MTKLAQFLYSAQVIHGRLQDGVERRMVLTGWARAGWLVQRSIHRPSE
jgi:hypothetical protein